MSSEDLQATTVDEEHQEEACCVSESEMVAAGDGGEDDTTRRLRIEHLEIRPHEAGGDFSLAAAAPPVGFGTIQADKYKFKGESGFTSTSMRKDLRPFYDAVRNKVLALGGILTSSGAVRHIKEGAGPGRSKTSFHYTGRAIDLFIHTAMKGDDDRYMVVRDGGTDANPEWKVFCVSVDPQPQNPLFDASLIRDEEIEYLVWVKDEGVRKRRRRAKFFSLTDIFQQNGWVRIPARSDWKKQYLSVEWWHWQHHEGLVQGVSRFGDELRKVWPGRDVDASGLALKAVFRRRSFVAP